ncbi:CLCN3 [Cordylochernes scorpioides]|uniref:CLCN3 n=1 Tax=Cordylochernes scorpioides TaxID=51811 RepID=A0ABY6K4Q6_9ARAC|nr:CLCN3 [Cordylochernes scorpioides]
MYLGILRHLREAIRKKRPEKWTNGDWILYHNNARPHTAHLVPWNTERELPGLSSTLLWNELNVLNRVLISELNQFTRKFHAESIDRCGKEYEENIRASQEDSRGGGQTENRAVRKEGAERAVGLKEVCAPRGHRSVGRSQTGDNEIYGKEKTAARYLQRVWMILQGVARRD